MIKTILGLFSRRRRKKTTTTTTTVTTIIPRPSAINVAVINECSVLTDAQIKPVVDALQVQVTRDFAPVYGIDAQLTFVPKGQTPPSGSWWLVIGDDSDAVGALGYHDLTNEGLPIGKVFAKTDLKYGANWTITTSHELLEMLADPWINLTVFNQTTNTAGKLFSWEVCDTCEADQYGYQINGITVSDFAYPGWWGIPGYTGKLDHMGHVKNVLEILPGGYIGEFDVSGGSGWKQVQSQQILHAHRNNFKHGSRRDRRNRDRNTWKKSTV